MAKNENNSHALIRKMVENIKQSKDAQAVSDAKTNEVHKTPALNRTHDPSNVECDAVCLPAPLCVETVHGVRCGHAHHHVEEHHLQPGITQRPAAAPALLHQTRQGWCFHRENVFIFSHSSAAGWRRRAFKFFFFPARC